MFPPFLLAKLYVKGSLKNTANGFEFTLKNFIESTLLVGIGPVLAGDKTYAADAIAITIADRTYQGAEISHQKPVPARVGVPLGISVAGESLPAGEQCLSVSVTSSDIGKVSFDIKDNVQQ